MYLLCSIELRFKYQIAMRITIKRNQHLDVAISLIIILVIVSFLISFF